MISCNILPATGKAGREMKAICLVASLAVLCAMAGASERTEDKTPSVLGFKAGDVVPIGKRMTRDADRALRKALYPAKAGFDRVLVLYTDKQGVCSVTGTIEVDDDVPQEAVVDRLMELAAARLGGREPTLSVPQSHNFAWLGEDAEPFDAVFLLGIAPELTGGDVSISFFVQEPRRMPRGTGSGG